MPKLSRERFIAFVVKVQTPLLRFVSATFVVVQQYSFVFLILCFLMLAIEFSMNKVDY